MTEYTEEQILKAWDSAYDPTNPEGMKRAFLAELQKPEVEFAEGEVVFCTYLEDDQPTGGYFSPEELTPGGLRKARCLTPTEHGPAVQALVRAAEVIAPFVGDDVLSSALEAYRSRHHE